MLKIVHPICCGIDVHKKFIVAAIATTDSEGVTTYQTKEFKIFNYDLDNLKAWPAKNNCVDVCMESTEKYWIPIFNYSESTCKNTLANPKYVKAIAGKKQTKRIHVGLPTCSNTICFPEAIFHLLRFVCFVTYADTKKSL